MLKQNLQTLLEGILALLCHIPKRAGNDPFFRETLIAIMPQLTDSMSVVDLQCIALFLEKLSDLLSFTFVAPAFPSEQEKRIGKIRQYLKENYKKNIRLSDIARHVGLSEEALCRFFKKHAAKTVYSCLNEIRIEASAQMLWGTDDSISGIAYSCGFNTICHFNTVFKQIKGMAPAKYREIANEKF